MPTKLKKLIPVLIVPIIVASAVFALFSIGQASALTLPTTHFAAIACDPGDPDPACNGGTPKATPKTNDVSSSEECSDTSATQGKTTSLSQQKLTKCIQDNKIVKDIQVFVNFLSGIVGILVVGSIMWGGIQYMVAGDNPSTVALAKKRITNSLLALAFFLLIVAILQFLIPGGVI